MDQDLREEEQEGQEATDEQTRGHQREQAELEGTTWDRDGAPPTKPQPTQKWKHNGQHTRKEQEPSIKELGSQGRSWGT
jgi:hypothetical protein